MLLLWFVRYIKLNKKNILRHTASPFIIHCQWRRVIAMLCPASWSLQVICLEIKPCWFQSLVGIPTPPCKTGGLDKTVLNQLSMVTFCQWMKGSWFGPSQWQAVNIKRPAVATDYWQHSARNWQAELISVIGFEFKFHSERIVLDWNQNCLRRIKRWTCFFLYIFASITSDKSRGADEQK